MDLLEGEQELIVYLAEEEEEGQQQQQKEEEKEQEEEDYDDDSLYIKLACKLPGVSRSNISPLIAPVSTDDHSV